MDLSRQLCELAGTEARKIKLTKDLWVKAYNRKGCYILFGNIYIEAEIKNDVKFFEVSINQEPQKIYGIDKNIDIHPNFETPENFVKLLECGFKCGYALHTDKFDITKSFVDNVLEATIYVLGNDCRGDFKQALQAESWVY